MKHKKQNENALLADVFVLQKAKKTQFYSASIRLKSQRLQN